MIAIVTILFYKLYMFIRSTRALTMFLGLLLIEIIIKRRRLLASHVISEAVVIQRGYALYRRAVQAIEVLFDVRGKRRVAEPLAVVR